jgi:photosystem II stability/assembly factor-like uncharacterized protein
VLYGVSFIDATHGTVVGDAGTILRTTNGGAIWATQSSGTTNTLRGVSFTDNNTGTAVGDGGGGGRILRTTNGGETWTLQGNGAVLLYGVCFTDANNGTAVGYVGPPPLFGYFLRTTNGGATWTGQTLSGAFTFRGVCFTDANTGTIAGAGVTGSGLILRTTNGGADWTYFYCDDGKLSVSFTDANIGTAVGWYGTILRTTNGGSTFVEQPRNAEEPSQFVLEQNYPNPFNPSTRISYQLPTQSRVTLKLYNLLVQEVVTLVNEVKQPGTHTVQWDASGVASGVYFYHIKAGDFVATKKLLLLK